MTQETNTHIYFLRNWMSNFQPCHTLIDPISGNKFKTTEHMFMWLKAIYFKDDETAAKILLAKTPQDAKDLGRQVKGYDDVEWNKVRYYEMLTANILKFTQNSELKKLLIATGNRQLVEANPKDQVWSCGLSEKDPLILDSKNWTGQNLLGKVLMEVRELIK